MFRDSGSDLSLNRRTFFGAAAASVAAAPGIAAAASEGTPYASGANLSFWPAADFRSLAANGECGPETMDAPRGTQFVPSIASGSERPRHSEHPDIDALRSISGVHRALLIRQKERRE